MPYQEPSQSQCLLVIVIIGIIVTVYAYLQ